MEKILIGGLVLYVVLTIAFGRWAFPRTKWLAVVLFLLPHPAAAQGITWTGPRLTPAEAAAVLANCGSCLSNVAARPALPEGPRVVVVGSRPGALGWLDFPPERPARRLDGTLLSDPPAVYGLPPWYGITVVAPHAPHSSTPRESNGGRNPRK